MGNWGTDVQGRLQEKTNDVRQPSKRETKRNKIRIEAGQRVLRFEDRTRKPKGRILVKECLKKKEKGICKIKNSRGRKEFFDRNGYSQIGIEQLRRLVKKMVKIIGFVPKSVMLDLVLRL
ncbi:hypothetical protein M0802_012283 [Mischocyttarus mexicanus]|nr:hypothetical protein M0802_012283 [Mischocyttarus mexicanus]